MELDFDLDLSWISEQESILDHSENIEIKPLVSIPVLVAYIDQGYVSFCKNMNVTLDVSGGECSILYSEKLIHIIQECKKELCDKLTASCGDKVKWSWAHGALFHIDTDISHVYSFSAVSGNKFLKPVDFYTDLVIVANPDIFHFSSQIYLFFEKHIIYPPTSVPIKPILKSGAGIHRGKSTKKVHIELQNPIVISNSKTIQKSRRTRRSS